MSFTLADDATIEFGPVEDVPAKLVAIQAFLDQVTLECLDVLDVREPGRVTASRVAGCAVPAPTDVDGHRSPDRSGDPADGRHGRVDDRRGWHHTAVIVDSAAAMVVVSRSTRGSSRLHLDCRFRPASSAVGFALFRTPGSIAAPVPGGG